MLDNLRLYFPISIVEFAGEGKLFKSRIVCHKSFVEFLFSIAKFILFDYGVLLRCKIVGQCFNCDV